MMGAFLKMSVKPSFNLSHLICQSHIVSIKMNYYAFYISFYSGETLIHLLEALIHQFETLVHLDPQRRDFLFDFFDFVANLLENFNGDVSNLFITHFDLTR